LVQASFKLSPGVCQFAAVGEICWALWVNSAKPGARTVHARKMRWLTYDPATDLDSPEQRAVIATAADDTWTPAQMAKFLDHVAMHRLGGCFALTLPVAPSEG
jgi:hypothetical protein